MVRWRLTEIMDKYREETGEPLLIRHLSLKTGLANSTVYHLVEGTPKRVNLATLNALLQFFNPRLGPLTVNDLLEFEDTAEV